MKQNKDKQIRELRRENKIWVIMIIVMSVIVLAYFIPKINELQTELQSCQDKVLVWTLKVRCEFHNVSTTSFEESSYNSYAEYERELKKFEIDRDYYIKQDWKTCEVLSGKPDYYEEFALDDALTEEQIREFFK